MPGGKERVDLRIKNLREVLAYRDQLRQTCHLCALGFKVEEIGYWPVSSRGQGRIMVVGHAPGEEEHKNGEPFVGRAGRAIDKLLWQFCGLTDSEVYFTNTVKCRPSQDIRLKTEYFRACAPYLTKEIALVDPKLIVYLGKESTLGTVDQADYPGPGKFFNTVIAGRKRKCYTMLHPALVFRDPKMRSAVISQMEVLGSYVKKKFGYSGARTRDIETSPNTEVEYILVDELSKLKAMYGDLRRFEFLGCDTETNSLDVWSKDFSLVGVSLAGEEDRAYYIPVGHKPDNRNVFARPFTQLGWDKVRPTLKSLLKGKQVVFHNYSYDYRVLKKNGLLVEGITPKEWHYHDSMIISYLHDETIFSLSLKDLIATYMHEHPQRYKDIVGNRRTFEYVHPEDALPYAGDDARNTLRLFNLVLGWVKKESDERTGGLLLKRIYPEELKVARVMSNAHMMGVKIDKDYVSGLKEVIEEDMEEVRQKLSNISSLADPGSPQQVIALLESVISREDFRQSFEIEFGAMSSQKEILLQLSERYRREYERVSQKEGGVLPGKWAPDLLEEYTTNIIRLRHLNKMLATYVEAMLSESEDQGGGELILHPDFKTVGTTSGRMSSGKRTEEDR